MIEAHKDAIEALLTAEGVNLTRGVYPYAVVHLTAGAGSKSSRRMSTTYGASDFYVYVNVHAEGLTSCYRHLDRVNRIENATPVVADRRCDPLAPHIISNIPHVDDDRADREVWTGTITWLLRSHAA